MSYCMSMTDNDFFVKAEDVDKVSAALSESMFDVGKNESGDIVSLDFTGQKLREQAEMFEQIAPFVKENSFVEMRGEDGLLWRWVFVDGKCLEINATITWPLTDEGTTNDKLTVALPNGMVLTAYSKDVADGYPGIAIDLLTPDGANESIVWAEYDNNDTWEDEKDRFRIFAWKQDQDEPVFNMAYLTGNYDE